MHPFNNVFDCRPEYQRKALRSNLRTLGNRLPKTKVNDEWMTPVNGLTTLFEQIFSFSLEEITLSTEQMDEIIKQYANM